MIESFRSQLIKQSTISEASCIIQTCSGIRRNEALSFAEKDSIASSVLNKHYGTDDIWKIILGQSVVLWIHKNDLHAGNEGPCSGRDLMLTNAVMQKIIGEH